MLRELSPARPAVPAVRVDANSWERSVLAVVRRTEQQRVGAGADPPAELSQCLAVGNLLDLDPLEGLALAEVAAGTLCLAGGHISELPLGHAGASSRLTVTEPQRLQRHDGDLSVVASQMCVGVTAPEAVIARAWTR